MDKKVTYHEQTDVENTLRLRDVLKTLPPFCRDFFRAIEPRTTTKTRISSSFSWSKIQPSRTGLWMLLP